MPTTGIQLVPDGATPTDPYTLQNDLASTTPGLGASSIGVAPNGCFTSTNVQDALEEICAGGGGGGPTTADQVSITDAGGYYTSTDVEGALQEVGADIQSIESTLGNLAASDVNIVDGGGYYTSTEVEGALQEVGSDLQDLSTSFDNLTASEVSVVDAGGYFTSTDVEGVLQELGAERGGSTSITTVGTITTGTWNATPIGDSYISSAASWNAKADNTVTVTGTNGLQGGGDLTSNRTLSPVYGSAANTVTEGNDARLSDARTPTGSAGGDLGSTYPNPSVERWQGKTLGLTSPFVGQSPIWNGTSWVPGNVPAGGSGGGGVTYFLKDSTVADPPIVGLPYPLITFQLGLDAAVGGTTATTAVAQTPAWTVVGAFVTDAGNPNEAAIPAGLWDMNLWLQGTAATNASFFRLKVYNYDDPAAPVLIATSDPTPINEPSVTARYTAVATIPQTPTLTSSRVYLEVEAQADLVGQSVTLHYGGSTPTYIRTTIPAISGTGLVHVLNGVVGSVASPVNFGGGATEVTGVLPVENGGTGLATTPTDGQLLIGNGSGYTLTELTAGTGIDITNGSGSIDIANTGVLSVGASSPLSSSGGQNPDISLDDSGVTAAAYGAAGSVATFTVTAKGLISLAADTAIQITESQVTDLTTHLGEKVPNTRTVNGHDLSADVTVTQSDVGLGNVENTALSTWPGSTNLTTLGTVTTGVWNGTTVDVLYGGTGATNESDARDNLGLTIGVDVQAWSATLDTLAAGTYTGSTSITTLGTVTSGVWNGTAIGDTYIASATYWNAKVDPSRTITTTAPLQGGGDLSADRTLSIPQADAGHDGFLSSADWSTFNDKVPQTRTVNGHALSGNVTVTKSDVGLSLVENTALSTWTGNTSINSVDTVTTGTWNANTIGPVYGGTGLSSYTLGDMLYASGANTLGRLAGNVTTTRKFIRQTGTGLVSAAPVWDTVTQTDVGLGNVENTALSTWAGSTNLTTLGTIATGTWSATAIAIARGGTGQTTKTAAFDALSPLTTLGDTLYGGAAGTGTRLAGNTTATKQFLSQTGTGAVSTAPSWSVVAKADVGLANVENTALSTWAGSTNLTTLGTIATGTWSATAIAIARGGTGATTKSGGFDALSPMTTLGDIVYGGAAGTGTRLAGNATTTRQFLREVGSGVAATAPVWDTVTKTDVGLANVENTALSTWAGSTSITTLGTIATGTVPAVRSSITDAGNYFTSTTVEGALQEVGANLRTTFTGSAALNFNTTNSQSSSDLTMTVTGASTGDVVSLGVPTAAILPNSCYTAWVSATNTVTVRFNNYDNASQNPTSGTFNVIVTAFGGGG